MLLPTVADQVDETLLVVDVLQVQRYSQPVTGRRTPVAVKHNRQVIRVGGNRVFGCHARDCTQSELKNGSFKPPARAIGAGCASCIGTRSRGRPEPSTGVGACRASECPSGPRSSPAP